MSRQTTSINSPVDTTDAQSAQHAFLIVGGGAGGLELACKLARKLGPGRVTLVDSELNHIWKPSLHEVAAGTLDTNQEGLSYLMLAHDNGFNFVLGSMTGLDTDTQQVKIGELRSDGGELLLAERSLPYGTLVIAVGSTANYFGIPGAFEHTIALNDSPGAERFRLQMLRALAKVDGRKRDGVANAGIDIVIIGGGATGVELAAELREASHVLANYGFRHLNPDLDVRLTLLEGADRILPPLPAKVAASAAGLLLSRHITVITECKVVNISADAVEDAAGNRYPADLCVWTAGIKAPAFLSELGLPTLKSDLLEVDAQLRVKGQDVVYALGDCAACLDGAGNRIPPRAQTAHQQADYLVSRFARQARGQSPGDKPFVYRDYGSLVSLGTRSSVGSLMGSLFKSSWFVEGFFARMMYASLHLMHHQAVMGVMRTTLLAVARFLVKRTRPQVKLH